MNSKWPDDSLWVQFLTVLNPLGISQLADFFASLASFCKHINFSITITSIYTGYKENWKHLINLKWGPKMADGSIAAPSLTLNDVIMTSMLLLKIIKNVFADFFVLSDTSLFNYFSFLLLHVFKMISTLFCTNLHGGRNDHERFLNCRAGSPPPPPVVRNNFRKSRSEWG